MRFHAVSLGQRPSAESSESLRWGGGGEGGWGFVNVVAGDTLRLALAKFLSLFCLHNLPSSDYSFRFLFA